MSDHRQLLGTSVLRVEDHHLLVGDTTFVADLDLVGALHAHFVTSLVAHARISRIDVSAARALPGVHEVLTATDLELAPMPGSPPNYPEGTARPVLATGVVRYVGEPIAVVVADTAAIAADAAGMVEVHYEPLPTVVRAADAQGNSVILFPELGTNVMVEEVGGNVAEIDFSRFDVVVDATFVNQRVAPCPLETRVAASMWTKEGTLVHYASCQGVHPLQAGLAQYYGLDKSSVRVITSDVGGSFGAKGRFYCEDILLPMLARRAGRPVRWIPSRSADMVGLGHSRAQLQTVRIAGDADGKIRAIQAHVLADCGAYPVAAPALAKNTGVLLPGPFDVTEVSWSTTCVVTNTTPTVAYRGAGRPESGALVDRAVDCFAFEVGIDPLEVRRKNLLAASDLPWKNASGVVYDSGDYREALELAAAAVGYTEIRAEQARREAAGETAKLLGVGISTFIDRTAGVPGSEYGAIGVKPDGSLRVLTGSSPYGQGHYTTWAMLVSERTGVPIPQIEVVHGDTDVIPRGGITGGSRSAQKAGSAVVQATEALVEQAKLLAAELLEANPADVVIDLSSARFHVAGSPNSAAVGWAEVAAAQAAQVENSSGEITFQCEADFAGDGPTVPYGCYAAVVEIDVETGAVELQRMITVDDAGTIINPMIVLGQVHGGLAQALGQALFEEFLYDEDGNPLTTTFLDYAFPSAAEMPSFECQLTEHASPNNPLGFKGIAESGTIGGVPAVQNAVADAVRRLGIRHIDLPLTPQRVWRALQGTSNASASV